MRKIPSTSGYLVQWLPSMSRSYHTVILVAAALLTLSSLALAQSNKKLPDSDAPLAVDAGIVGKGGPKHPPTDDRSKAVAVQTRQDKAALKNFPEANHLIQNVSPVIKQAARNHIENSFKVAAQGKPYKIKSEDRAPGDPLYSVAHSRGAVDVGRPMANMRDAAPIVNKALGNDKYPSHYPEVPYPYTTIYEHPMVPNTNQGLQTIYHNGSLLGNTSTLDHVATGDHIHVQPNFNSRMYNAAQTPGITYSGSSVYHQAPVTTYRPSPPPRVEHAGQIAK
jgi:hypothetical protein